MDDAKGFAAVASDEHKPRELPPSSDFESSVRPWVADPPGRAAHTTLPPRSRRDHGRIDMARQDKSRHDLGHLPSCFNCYDKAFIESFWSSLKYELVYHHCFATRAEARTAIFDYVETFYNRTKLHSSLACLGPINFESQLNQITLT